MTTQHYIFLENVRFYSYHGVAPQETAIGNEFISIIKESSILYTIGIYELTYQANKLASTNFRYLETLTISALIYFVLTFTASRLLGMLERRMRRGDR